MKKFIPFLILIMALLFQQCQNLEDAPIVNRNTFMHFYEGGNSYIASAAEITSDGGFIIVGSITIGEDDSKMVIIKTDQFGQPQWERPVEVDGGTANSIMETADGYIVLGDSIQINPNSEKNADRENNWSRMVNLNSNGSIQSDKSFALSKDDPTDIIDIHIDFHAKSITKDDQGNLITLGSFKVPGATENAFIAALNPTSLDTLWTKQYNYIDRDYALANGVYYNNAGNILWASSLSISQGTLSRGYLTIPVVKDSSTFVNSDYYGETSDRSFIVNDIRPAANGYCAIGTTSATTGDKRNLFYIQIDNSGNFKPSSVRYFDGVNSENNTSLTPDPTISVSEDTGDAITATSDGGFLLGGSIVTTPQRGNGGKDIWLIRLDGSGNVLWNKLIGGSTDETVASIRETSDGGFLICGSKSLGGQSSILLIKTDKNGELRN